MALDDILHKISDTVNVGNEHVQDFFKSDKVKNVLDKLNPEQIQHLFKHDDQVKDVISNVENGEVAPEHVEQFTNAVQEHIDGQQDQ